MRRLNDREMLCRRLDIIPAETVVRNIVAGSMAKRLGREEGEKLKHPIVEYYYKSDALDDPLIYPEHAVLFGWRPSRNRHDPRDGAQGQRRAEPLSGRARRDPGRLQARVRRHHGKILLGDEICPDTCRFWDKATLKKLDKDRFRRDLGDVEGAYHEMLRRVSN